MKISDLRAAQIAQAYGLQSPADAGSARRKKAEPRVDTDSASLSPAAQELLRARRAAGAAEEVRPELVAELRRQVQSGTYTVDAQALAQRLLAVLKRSGGSSGGAGPAGGEAQ
jgi:flagellar biosynthesis anti-sigma factor FlgM